MAFRHGVRTSETPTSVISPVEATAGLQVVIGTAPLNLAKTNEYINKPLLAYQFDEAVQALGYSNNWKDYTLCEVMDAAFRLYGVAPVVFINVLDPKKHKSEGNEEVSILNKKAVVSVEGILLDTLKVSLTETGQEFLSVDEDYIATFDENGKVNIAVVPGGKIPQEQTSLYVSFSKIDPKMVTKTDIIGGIDIDTGDSTGLELINSVFPKFGLVPGQILAPGFSHDPTVEAVMKAKAGVINSYFKAVAIVDIDTTEADTYTKVSEWKNKNNYTAANEFPCWPKVGLGEKVYHMSTQLASLITLTDSKFDDIPYVSPSNQSFQMNKAVLESGKEVNLGPDQAEYINGQGIVTALNFIGGWKAWGNRTGAYPGTNDVKDVFIPVRRMHNWVANTLILTTWSKVDGPINRTLIDSIVDSVNTWLNGLTNTGALIGARVVCRKEDNPTTNLLNGKVKYKLFIAEPTPGEDFEFDIEFDATYYNRLFQQ